MGMGNEAGKWREEIGIYYREGERRSLTTQGGGPSRANDGATRFSPRNSMIAVQRQTNTYKVYPVLYTIDHAHATYCRLL